MRYFLITILFFSVLPPVTSEAWAVRLQDYQLFEKQGKQGLKDNSGKVVIPAEYDALGWSQGDVEVIKGVIGFKQNSRWGLLNVDNDIVADPIYTQLYNGGQNLLIAAKNDERSGRDYLGLISPKGHEVLPFKYAYVHVSPLRVIVARKTKTGYTFGLLGFNGDVIIPLMYKNISAVGGLRFAVKDFENKTAIYDDNGKQLIGFELDSISNFMGDYAIIYDKYKRGLIAKTGKIILAPKYQHVVVENNEIRARALNTWDLLKEDGSNLATFSTGQLAVFSPDYMLASANGRFWLVDRAGKMATADSYQAINKVNDRLATFKTGGRWGVLNLKGEVKLPAEYDSVMIDEDMIMAQKKGHWSLYDTFNVRKTTTRYDEIGKRSGRLFPVKKNAHWGFIDRAGEEVIHCVYDHVGHFKDDLVWVKFHKEAGVIDRKGEWVVLPSKADSIEVLSPWYYISYENGLKKLSSFDGGLIYFTENDIAIKDGYLLEYISDGGIWKINFSGQIVEEARDESYEEVRKPSEGFYAIKKDGRYGFIDAENRLRIANRYQGVGDFHEGMAAFKLLGKWGFINKKEEIVIQPNYDRVSPFHGRVAVAYENSHAGLIDRKGNKISSFHFDSLVLEDNGRFLAYQQGKVGLLGKEGRLMINAKYDFIKDLNNGFAIAGKAGKYGLVDNFGVNTIPMIYDRLIYDGYRKVYLAMKKSTLEKVQHQ